MKKVKLIRQTTVSECGLCSVAMVAAYYGHIQAISTYRNTFSIGRDGTSLKEIYDILNSVGLNVRVFKCSSIKDYSCADWHPYILFCKEHHFTVVQKTKKGYLVSDPAGEQKQITCEELDESFAGVLIDAVPGENFNPARDRLDDMRYVKQIISKCSGYLWGSFVLTIAAYVSSILVSILLQQEIDKINYGKIINLKEITLSFVIVLAGYILFNYMRNRVNVGLEVSMSEKVNIQTMYHILRIPYSFYDNRSAGNILYRLGILDHLRDVITTNFVGTFVDMISLICVFVYISIMFSHLSVIMAVLIVLSGLYTALIAGRTIKKQKERLNASESVTDIRTEIVNNIFQIKCLHLENYFWNSFMQVFRRFQDKYKTEQKYSVNVSLGYSTVSAFVPVIVTLYSYVCNPENMTAGMLLLIYSLVGMLMNCAYGVFGQLTTLLQVKSIVFYLNDMLDEPECVHTGKKEISSFEKLELCNVNFRYTKHTEMIVQNLNMKVEAGQKIGIVGMTGSGKTTIVKLIMGLYEPSIGTININGKSLKEIGEKSLNHLVSVVPQMPIIFDKNIKENITLGDESIDDYNIANALECACILDDIKRLPLGLDTYISGQGGNLSGGQVQRLSLARAIAHNPQLLIMDEATSSLDASTENQIYNNLKKRKISTIAISHRLSTICDADCLYFFNSDRSISVGTHIELMENNADYRYLFEQQLDTGRKKAMDCCEL